MVTYNHGHLDDVKVGVDTPKNVRCTKHQVDALLLQKQLDLVTLPLNFIGGVIGGLDSLLIPTTTNSSNLQNWKKLKKFNF